MFKRFLLASCLVTLAACAGNAPRQSAPAASEPAGSIRYPSVQAALRDLADAPGTEVKFHPEWTVVYENASGAIWTFTVHDHPAHPAVVKRTPVQRPDGLFMQTEVLCEAGRGACDALVREFEQMNRELYDNYQRIRSR